MKIGDWYIWLDNKDVGPYEIMKIGDLFITLKYKNPIIAKTKHMKKEITRTIFNFNAHKKINKFKRKLYLDK